ncbi:MAG: hypothetical protein D5R98_10155 [Desulfonatronovibrio sp. MSAO_Bac4]|nr:MAG: hypothetical protein D5R98_10155 [Desulfonatronovibrio sp. MSAO_Bac4]
MKKSLLAAISPCPNDTYIFGAWVLGMVGDLSEMRTRFVWEDVQTLNEMAESGGADIIKVSAVQALKLDNYEMLSCGGAFGLGDGPKLVARPGLNGTPEKIGVPGTLTTAYALLGAAADFDFESVPMFFHEIPDAISNGLVDAGLLIHETALVYEEMGFEMILDLGQWWKVRSDDSPLPLGVIIMRKSLGRDLFIEAEGIIRKSITAAEEKYDQVRPMIKSLARELDDRVIDEHIRAYVNDCSYDMGDKGVSALSVLKKITGLTNE